MRQDGQWSSDVDQAYVSYMESVVKYDHRPTALRIARDLDPMPAGVTVVDVAGGPAFLSLELAPKLKEPRLVVVDSSRTMLEVGQTRARARGFVLETVESGAEAIALPDACADLVLCKHFLRLAPALDASLREMLRILRPGARAYFVDFNGEAPLLGKVALWSWIQCTAPRALRQSLWASMGRGLPVSSLPARLSAQGFRGCAILGRGVSYLVRAERPSS
jgi:ubiquinone/menaquinone biosynthesis C-methylase UbiE